MARTRKQRQEFPQAQHREEQQQPQQGENSSPNDLQVVIEHACSPPSREPVQRHPQQPFHIGPNPDDDVFSGPALPRVNYQSQPNHNPSFRNALEAQSNHLLRSGWRPIAGTFGLPVDGAGNVPDHTLFPYTCQLYNAFNDVSQVWDTQNRRDTAMRFLPGREWTSNPDDIEAISHVIVGTAASLHVTGAIGLQYRRLHGNNPCEKDSDAKLTFAQRIWLIERLVRHYKVQADHMMRQHAVEDYVIWSWRKLMAETDFRARFVAIPEPERMRQMAEFTAMGLPVMRTGAAPLGSNVAGGPRMNHQEAASMEQGGMKRSRAEAMEDMGNVMMKRQNREQEPQNSGVQRFDERDFGKLKIPFETHLENPAAATHEKLHLTTNAATSPRHQELLRPSDNGRRTHSCKALFSQHVLPQYSEAANQSLNDFLQKRRASTMSETRYNSTPTGDARQNLDDGENQYGLGQMGTSTKIMELEAGLRMVMDLTAMETSTVNMSTLISQRSSGSVEVKKPSTERGVFP